MFAGRWWMVMLRPFNVGCLHFHLRHRFSLQLSEVEVPLPLRFLSKNYGDQIVAGWQQCKWEFPGQVVNKPSTWRFLCVFVFVLFCARSSPRFEHLCIVVKCCLTFELEFSFPTCCTYCHTIAVLPSVWQPAFRLQRFEWSDLPCH